MTFKSMNKKKFYKHYLKGKSIDEIKKLNENLEKSFQATFVKMIKATIFIMFLIGAIIITELSNK